MCLEKRTDDCPAEGSALNSGRLPSALLEANSPLQTSAFQLTEGSAQGQQESDPLIVVRDGRTDHKAKERAGEQRRQSTHARGTNSPAKDVFRTLSALGTKATKAPKHKFCSLARLLDKQLLTEAYHQLKKRAAPGIDGVTHAEYGQALDENLLHLVARLKDGSYRAQPVKRKWIAKPGSSKMRPLGIPVLEDKIVQQAVKMILEPIWEKDFVEESIGYRPGRKARQATLELSEALDSGKHRWIVEADIKGFFDHINHDWLIAILEQRIADKSLIRIIRKWLNAVVLDELKEWSPSNEGTPQGGVISPLLGNIYLHFVQDLWIKKVVAKESKGSVLFRRYADDSIVAFQRKDDAERYLQQLPSRLAKFGLQLAMEKSALVKFNRWEPETSGKFTFLGFDFYWKKTRRNPNHWKVFRSTNAKKFRANVAALKEWLKKARSQPLREILTTLRRKLQGYWNYYCVIGNSERTGAYAHVVRGLLFKWFNWRSQRKSFSQAAFDAAWPRWKLPGPKVNEKPSARFARQAQAVPA
jgi:group II intron reverse transcriptase/maturase